MDKTAEELINSGEFALNLLNYVNQGPDYLDKLVNKYGEKTIKEISYNIFLSTDYYSKEKDFIKFHCNSIMDLFAAHIHLHFYYKNMHDEKKDIKDIILSKYYLYFEDYDNENNIMLVSKEDIPEIETVELVRGPITQFFKKSDLIKSQSSDIILLYGFIVNKLVDDNSFQDIISQDHPFIMKKCFYTGKLIPGMIISNEFKNAILDTWKIN